MKNNAQKLGKSILKWKKIDEIENLSQNSIAYPPTHLPPLYKI